MSEARGRSPLLDTRRLMRQRELCSEAGSLRYHCMAGKRDYLVRELRLLGILGQRMGNQCGRPLTRLIKDH